LLENVLDFEEGLSEQAKKSARKAFLRIVEIDKNLVG
jgi:hydrogenase maturation protease superfamily